MASRKCLGGEGSAPAPHVLAVDDSSVDRAVIAGILRSSQFRGENSYRSISVVSAEMSLLPEPSLCRGIGG
jgi:CheY-like chemotaxis protein